MRQTPIRFRDHSTEQALPMLQQPRHCSRDEQIVVRLHLALQTAAVSLPCRDDKIEDSRPPLDGKCMCCGAASRTRQPAGMVAK